MSALVRTVGLGLGDVWIASVAWWLVPALGGPHIQWWPTFVGVVVGGALRSVLDFALHVATRGGAQ